MSNKRSNKKKTKESEKQPLPLKKKILFYSITLSIPILFFVIIEIVLRSADYMGNTDLFIDPEIPGDVEYLMPNPNFAARYFFYTRTIPNPSQDLFLKEKPENGLRIFALGGSSAAGYPYGYNGTYSRVVKDILTDKIPDKEVEVINVGVSAVNSYTLFDQVDEILEQSPDAIMIYAGHNEFYGALGVGSNEKLGGFPGFVRFYLKLQRLKTFMFLRTIIVDTGKWFAGSASGEDPERNATLMERIVDSRSIELGSPTYELAMHQFRSNLTAIVKKFRDKGIPVYIGSVESNLKDHPPFVNITDGDTIPAQKMFDEAKLAYDAGEMHTALNKFIMAKDLDGLKFRAPSEINEIIREATQEFENLEYVPVSESFREYESDGITGFELMLEHLHPNQMGYFLMGKTFAETYMDAELTDREKIEYYDKMYMSDLDRRIAYHRVRTLKQGFPFIMGEKPSPYQLTYQPDGILDSLAFNIVHRNINWDRSKVELADHYIKEQRFDMALKEYMGLKRNQPWNESPYVYAAKVYISLNQYDKAGPLLEDAYKINSHDAFITKMLGAIQVQEGNSKRAIELLEQSRSLNARDPQMLYNLSGAYGTDQQFKKALEIANELEKISPNYPGLVNWKQQLTTILQRTGN